MGASLSLYEATTNELVYGEIFLAKLESFTEFNSLDLLLPHFAKVTDLPADRLFRAVSTQLDSFWLPERQKVEHEDKQNVLDALCWFVDNCMKRSNDDVVDQVEGETLEKLFRSLIPFLVLNFDDSTDESDWTPKCVYLKELLWRFAFYDDVEGKYQQNQTKLITSIIGLMEKVNETPESEFNNLFSGTYSSDELKDRFMGALAFVLSRFEGCEVDLMDHIEFDQVLFSCYRFMQHYAGDNLWSLNLEALGQVRTLVRYIADKMSNEIFDHLTLIENDVSQKKLKLNSVVLIQYLTTLKLVPLECTFENIRLDTSDEVEMGMVKDAGEEEGGEVRSDEIEGGEKETLQDDDEELENGEEDDEEDEDFGEEDCDEVSDEDDDYCEEDCNEEDDEEDEDFGEEDCDEVCDEEDYEEDEDEDYDEDEDCDEEDEDLTEEECDEQYEENADEQDLDDEMESETEMENPQPSNDESENLSPTLKPTEQLNDSISSSFFGFW